nr:urease D [Sporosarcina pasteurii]
MTARLSMEFQYRGNKTVLSNCYQNPPLRASRPLYINPANRSEATVYLVETSGGIVEGDHNVFDIDIKEGADVCLIPQSATKIYPSYNGIWSSQDMDITIGPKASLSFKTEAVIPFEQARFNSKTVIQMTSDSTFLWGDILSPGRVARGEVFEYTDVRTNFQVWMDDECLIYDPLLISKDNMGLKKMGMLEDHLFIGSWVDTPTIGEFRILGS